MLEGHAVRQCAINIDWGGAILQSGRIGGGAIVQSGNVSRRFERALYNQALRKIACQLIWGGYSSVGQFWGGYSSVGHAGGLLFS